MQKTRNARQSRGNDKKRHAEVVEAATRVFNAKGYEASTIQDIADELGILKGSVYYYITSKEDILYDILKDVHRAGFETALRAVEIDGGPLEKIHSFVSTLSQFHAENRLRMAILVRELRALNQKRRKEIVQERDRYEEILRELITNGQEGGLIPPEIDPKITTRAIMGMVNTIHQWYRPTGGLKPETIGAMYGDLAVRAVSGKTLAATGVRS